MKIEAAPTTIPSAEEVAKLRDDFGLSPAEFGAVVGYGGPAVYAWEAGRRECPALVWEFLQVYFGRAKMRMAPGVFPKGAAVPDDVKAQLRTLDKVRKLFAELS